MRTWQSEHREFAIFRRTNSRFRHVVAAASVTVQLEYDSLSPLPVLTVLASKEYCIADVACRSWLPKTYSLRRTALAAAMAQANAQLLKLTQESSSVNSLGQ